MTQDEAIAALGDGNTITVQTRSGSQYIVERDVLECFNEGFVYGFRSNGTRGGPFHRRTQDQLRWFYLKNVRIVEANE